MRRASAVAPTPSGRGVSSISGRSPSPAETRDRHFKRASDRIASVDDGVGVVGGLRVDQLQRGRGDEMQRFGQRGLPAKAADLGAGIAQDQQGALEIGVGLIFTW